MARTTTAEVRYINSNPPPEVIENGVVTLGEPAGVSREEYKKRRHLTTESHQVEIIDARSVPGGISSWNLTSHGFACVKPPPPVDFSESKNVREQYYERVADLAKKHCGAKEGFVFQHSKRTENPKSLTAAYARFGHSDSGPDSPPLFRQMLVERYGMSEEEVANSDLMWVNFWHPIDRPAFKDPLCLLDASTVTDLSKERVKVRYAASNENRAQAYNMNEGTRKATDGFAQSKEDEAKTMKLFAAGKAAGGVFADPGLSGPIYAPKHRWVYCPDMKEDEAWIFTQYDTRDKGVTDCTFHSSFHDPFYDGNKDTPGRRSLEFRIILTFPKKATSKL